MDRAIVDEAVEVLAQVARRDAAGCPIPEDDLGPRAFVPLGIPFGHHRHLLHPLVPAQGALELLRGDPLAADLDDILEPVGDPDVAVPVEVGDVAGVKPASVPQLAAAGLVAVVALGEPGAAEDELPHLLAVRREERVVWPPDPRLDQWEGEAGAAEDVELRLAVGTGMLRLQVGCCHDRTRFRHPVAPHDADAAGLGLGGEPLGERGPTDHELQAGIVDAGGRGMMEEHLDERRHAVGKGDRVPLDQFRQPLRLVLAGIDLLQPEHRCQVGDPPGVDVEHRRQGEIGVVGMNADGLLMGGEGRPGGERVEDDLPVGEVDPLRVAGGAGGVEERGDGVLVEIGPFVAASHVGCPRLEERLVVTGEGERRLRRHAVVGERHPRPHVGEARGEPLGDGKEVGMEEKHRVTGMADRPPHLFRREADVDGVEHRPEHRYGEEQLEVAMAVPVHHPDPIPRLHPQANEHRRSAVDASEELGVVVLAEVAVGDRLPRRPRSGPREQITNEKLLDGGNDPGLADGGIGHGCRLDSEGLVQE